MISKNLICSFCMLASLLIPARALNPNWKSFIDSDVFRKFIGKNNDDRFSRDFFEGDIDGIDDSDQINFRPKARDVYSDSAVRWESGLVPYNISNKFSMNDRTMIENALQSISDSTSNCIQFVPLTTQLDFLSIIDKTSCFSRVGRQGGRQFISLHDGCIENVGVIQHVIMHALGFYHENARLDRDQFVTLNEENIMPSARTETFQKYVNLESKEFPYDTESITHFPFNVFAIDTELPTIVPTKLSSRIGQTDGLTQQDVAKIRRAYLCDKQDSVLRPKLTTERPFATTEDNNFVTSNPPDDELVTTTTDWTTELATFSVPSFRMDPITPIQCFSLNTDNCRILPASKNCSAGMGLLATCSADALNIEIEFFFSKIQSLNASRALEVTIGGEREFKKHTFTPVADVLINLIVADYSNFKLSYLRSLELPILTHIGFTNCTNIVIKREDFLPFPKLTMFVMLQSTAKDIEDGSFDSLFNLKQLSFDIGYKMNQPFTPAVREHLRLLHCDCRFVWLRNFLKKHPLLMRTTSVGQVHGFGGILSHALTSHQLFVAVDCGQPDLIGKNSQTEFSIESNCPSETNGSGIRK